MRGRSPKSYNILEHGIDRRGVIPQPSVCNPDYTVSLACEDRDWACKKKDGKSEQKHLYELTIMLRRAEKATFKCDRAVPQECKHKQFQIGMENTATHNQNLSKKVNQRSKIYEGHNVPPPDGSPPPPPPPKSSRSSPSPLSK